MKTKQEMINYIYNSDKISGRFYWTTLEINLNDIISTLYRLQLWEWKKYEENTQFWQILLELCDLYWFKKGTIEKQNIECINYVFNFLNEK